MKLGFREKIIAAAALLLLIVVGWYFLYFSPKKSEIDTMKQQIENIQREISSVNVTPALLDSLKKEIEQLRTRARRNMTLSIPQDSILFVTNVIQQKIKEYDLEIVERIKPNREALFSSIPVDSLTIKTGIRPVDIDFSLKGTYFNLVKFLDSFKGFPFLIRAGEIEIGTDDTLWPDLMINLKVYIYIG